MSRKVYDVQVSLYIEAENEEEARERVAKWLDERYENRDTCPKGFLSALVKKVE